MRELQTVVSHDPAAGRAPKAIKSPKAIKRRIFIHFNPDEVGAAVRYLIDEEGFGEDMLPKMLGRIAGAFAARQLKQWGLRPAYRDVDAKLLRVDHGSANFSWNVFIPQECHEDFEMLVELSDWLSC